ncbi:hypothetical protein EY04_25470 [Pseudomonas chlororaphis]|nr:hypothetical protein EY04_25470 [Pseudomonas chlororaphis]QHC91657.1 hypothetical protein PchlR47_26260 [Pseudomonas chlororaphis]
MYTVQKMQRLHRRNRGQSNVDQPLLQKPANVSAMTARIDVYPPQKNMQRPNRHHHGQSNTDRPLLQKAQATPKH